MSVYRQSVTDTIAAISTAVSESGIGIVRISGPDAILTADRIYRSPKGKTHLKDVPTHTIHYGFAADPDSHSLIDEVLVSVMRAPRSYTAEDVVEISCHGGVLVVRQVLGACLKAGARPAEPGEFTKRAYLNGRIDLSEAEAVMDVIESKNQYALRNSLRQMKGALGDAVRAVRSGILYQTAHIEAALDDPEHLSFEPCIPELKERCTAWRQQIRRLLSTADSGRLMQEGIRTVIVGKPNAGKSSLLNLLLGEDRAIVTPIAGTTRDVLTETVTLEGMTLRITDTAGIRRTDDPVEKIGVKRAEDSVSEADLLLCVFDASCPLDEDDLRILRMAEGRQAIILLNKSDLPAGTDTGDILAVLSKDRQKSGSHTEIPPVISFSAKEETGLDKLKQTLREMFFHGSLSFNDEIVITSARHRALLEQADRSLASLQESLDAGMPEDFYSIDLMGACEALGSITGEDAGEDLVDEIFSKFCMGK